MGGAATVAELRTCDKSGAAAYMAPPASNLNQILVQFHAVTNSNISLINSVMVIATTP
jgi:hypothetical protein